MKRCQVKRTQRHGRVASTERRAVAVAIKKNSRRFSNNRIKGKDNKSRDAASLSHGVDPLSAYHRPRMLRVYRTRRVVMAIDGQTDQTRGPFPHKAGRFDSISILASHIYSSDCTSLYVYKDLSWLFALYVDGRAFSMDQSRTLGKHTCTVVSSSSAAAHQRRYISLIHRGC